MKKLKIKFTKKGIIALSVLLLLLAAAIYLNIRYNTDDPGNLDVMGNADEQDGDLQPVDAKVYNDYFVAFRNERNNIRAQEIEYLRAIISQGTADADTIADANARLMELVNNMEKEFTIENRIKAKGFLDAAVTFQNGTISVIIDGTSLTDEEVARILDIVRSESDLTADKITISLTAADHFSRKHGNNKYNLKNSE